MPSPDPGCPTRMALSTASCRQAKEKNFWRVYPLAIGDRLSVWSAAWSPLTCFSTYCIHLGARGTQAAIRARPCHHCSFRNSYSGSAAICHLTRGSISGLIPRQRRQRSSGTGMTSCSPTALLQSIQQYWMHWGLAMVTQVYRSLTSTTTARNPMPPHTISCAAFLGRTHHCGPRTNSERGVQALLICKASAGGVTAIGLKLSMRTRNRHHTQTNLVFGFFDPRTPC